MKIIVEVLCILLVCTSPLYAQNIGDDNYYSSGSPSGSQLLPSEVYYNENIAVNVIASASPSAGESGGGVIRMMGGVIPNWELLILR